MNNIVSTIIESLTEFVSGIGSAFVEAFQHIFMIPTTVEGVVTYSGINDLGVFLLVMMGIGLGYGIVRFIVGLFRREV